jgi:hypothetical protein
VVLVRFPELFTCVSDCSNISTISSVAFVSMLA